ncbi:hypothetical protein SAY87_005398 [Trapa incisa]|uniref:Uncharacterized protein n=1 Tax=Trapa incisa TaxID=236973 RepID=A0AAN7QBM8_9MYRT|nr:hypothetical protein SAY87_005398 [Trapa incisa]
MNIMDLEWSRKLISRFNHKTGAEGVHFTNVSSYSESDDNDVDNNQSTDSLGEENSTNSPTQNIAQNMFNDHSEDGIPSSKVDPTVLQMIMVKNVKAGVEMFNTYGSVGNAVLLHIYGFMEENNPYDIVNIDMA